MELILVRHADAEDEAESDFARELTAKGRKQSARVGKFLARLGLRPDMIVTSPLVRAQQTAAILHEETAAVNGVAEDKRLACGMTPEEAYAVAEEYGCEGTLLLVGHEPDFSRLAADLTGMAGSGNLEIKKASCAMFAVASCRGGGGRLLWLVTPKLLGEA